MGCGLLTEEMVGGFQKLLTHPDIDAAKLEKIADALPVGAPERYLASVNELLIAEKGFGDFKLLRDLVDHPGLQTVLLEEGRSSFKALIKVAGNDVAAAERRVAALEIAKRRSLNAGGQAEYDRLLAKLASGSDLAAEESLRHSRRAQQLSYHLGPEIQDLVIDALRATDRKAFDATRANLRKKLYAFGSPEQIAVFEQSLTTAWRVEKLELSAGPLQSLSRAERVILEDMSMKQWNDVLLHAQNRRGWYAKHPDRAAYNVKGLLAEEIYYASPAHRDAMNRARELALQRGLDPESVRLVRRIHGETLSERTGKVGVGELTDGVIVANPYKSAGGKVVTDFEEMHVLTVMESKSPSNVAQLAGEKPGAKLPKNWVPDDMLPFEANYFGQLSEDFERFSFLSTRFGQQWVPPKKVRISRKWTEWIAVHPPGHPIPASVAERLFGKPKSSSSPAFDNIKAIEGLVRDDQLNKVAEQVFKVLAL